MGARGRRTNARANSRGASTSAKKPCKKCAAIKRCKHLKKGNPNGKGRYRGGSYSGAPGSKGKSQESHHAPAKTSYPKGFGVPIGDMPSLQMTKSDHHQTASHGRQGDEGKRYRAEQKKLIQSGQHRKAMAKDIRDIRKIARDGGDPKKYDEAIKEMRAYAKCLEKEGVLK